MKRQELATWTAIYTKQMNQAQAALDVVKAQYIEANATHPIGCIVTVMDCNDTHILRIDSYDIKEGRLIPNFVTLENKRMVLSDRYEILD